MEYIEQYKILHSSDEHYGTSSSFFLPEISLVLDFLQPKTVLDYGCGKASLTKDLAKKYPDITFYTYDPAIPGIDALPCEKCDLIINTDVLEHIPESALDDVLRNISSISKNVFFVLHHALAVQILPNGENAHCTVRPPQWYYDKMLRFFNAPYPLPSRNEVNSVIITFSPDIDFIQKYYDLMKQNCDKVSLEENNKNDSTKAITPQLMSMAKIFVKCKYLFFKILSKLTFGNNKFSAKVKELQDLLSLIQRSNYNLNLPPQVEVIEHKVKNSAPQPTSSQVSNDNLANFQTLYDLQIALFNAQMEKNKEVYIPTFDKPSKLLRLERTGSGALCYVNPKLDATQPAIAVVTLPKSGTYLLARCLTHLGYADCRVHASDVWMSDYRDYDILNFTDGNPRSKEIPFFSQMQLGTNGSFIVGHIPYDHCEMLTGKRIILSMRDLRTTFVSFARYTIMKEQKTNNIKSNECTESSIYDFISSGTAHFIINCATSIIKWKNDFPSNVVLFEELALHPLTAELRSVQNLASILGRDPIEIVSALEQARGSQTLTFSGKHSSLDGLWSERVEKRFQELGGHELNEKLGYAKEWKKS